MIGRDLVTAAGMPIGQNDLWDWFRFGDDGGHVDGVKAQVLGRAVLLMGSAMALVLLVIGIGVAGVLVVTAAVQFADLLHQADHGLVMMVRHGGREQHHHHCGHDRQCAEFP